MTKEDWNSGMGHAIDHEVSCWLPTIAAWVPSQVRYVGFLVDKVEMGWVFSEYLGFPCKLSFHKLLYIH
jgi:hypothetical protein